MVTVHLHVEEKSNSGLRDGNLIRLGVPGDKKFKGIDQENLE